MDETKRSGLPAGVTESGIGENPGFVLTGARIVLTEYKMMQNQESASLLPCMRYRQNGQDAVCYLARGRRTFADILETCPEGQFFALTSDLFLNIARLQENGLLSCRKTDLSFHRIYADADTGRTRLLYYPLDAVLFRDESDFMEALRGSFIRYLTSDRSALTGAAEEALRDLQDYSLTVRDIGERLGRYARHGSAPGGPRGSGAVTAVLTAVGLPYPLVFHVDRDRFTIGRGLQTADGVIPGDRRVGRAHCRLIRNGGQMALQDLESVNGTYVNRKRLLPGTLHVLSDGDRIRIAGTEFSVRLQRQGQTVWQKTGSS